MYCFEFQIAFPYLFNCSYTMSKIASSIKWFFSSATVETPMVLDAQWDVMRDITSTVQQLPHV